MSNYLLQFNGYSFPLGFVASGHESSQELGEQELPRLRGSAVQTARSKSRALTIAGSLTGNSGNATTDDILEARIDAMRAACETPAGPAVLYMGRDDRFFLAQVEKFSRTYPNKMYGSWADVNISFLAGCPDAYAAVAGGAGTQLVTGPVALPGTVTAGGTAPSCPVYSLTLGAGTGSVTVANSATGQSMAVSGTFSAGDVVTLDAWSYAVLYNGVSTPGLLTNASTIPQLLPGANVISVAATGVSVSAASLTYCARYA